MIIVLVGYMASGKSVIGTKLASCLKYEFVDLDAYIEKSERRAISEIFKSSGEIYFRKKEIQYLQELINTKTHTVLSLGGGTPCYANNMSLLLNTENVTSIYLKNSIGNLVARLMSEKEKRPLIAHIETKEGMTEFIGKHLFERVQFYGMANHTIDTNAKSTDEVIEAIMLNLF